MTKWLKAGLLVLGAVCVLLWAGALPWLGVPAVYRGGAMLLLGVGAALLCAAGAWRLGRGKLAHFLFGLFFTFLSAAGAAAVWNFGAAAVRYAALGGPMWFGAVGMGCLAVVGGLFTGIFGFFAWRLMTRRLWLAAVHACGLLVLVGAFLDASFEVVVPLRVVAGNGQAIEEVKTEAGELLPLGFSLTVQDFSVAYYGEESYTLYRREVQDGAERWSEQGKPVRQGDELVLGERRWPVSDLRRSPEMPMPFLLAGTAEDLQLLMEDSRTVRDFCASCRVDSLYRGRKETHDVAIRVNEPLSFKGWVIHLMSYRSMGDKTLVEFRARRAPGRLFALAGMVGLIISTACWCWKRKEDETPDPATEP